MNTRLFHRLWAGLAAALLPAAPAPAQFTSTYSYVTLAANFNGYDTFTPRMRLISNGVWQSYVPYTNFSNPQFLFATTNFGLTWKETNQPPATLPLQGTAELNAGNDIALTSTISGTLRFRFSEDSGAYSVFNVTAQETNSPPPWINELHYDNDDADANEGVEVAGAAGLNLSGYQLYFYDGGDDGVYKSNNLTGTIPDQGGGFGTLWFAFPFDIQNGPSDGIALVQGHTSVIQYLSYEGVDVVPTNGPAVGLAPQNIGVSESDATPVGFTLQLVGTGNTYGSFTWASAMTNSSGLPNTGQAFVPPPLPAVLTITNVMILPGAPLSNDTVHVQVNLTPSVSASNLSATTFFRTNGAARFSPLAMANVSGNTYRTSTPIPAQPAGAYVDFHLFVNFDGPGTNSPTLYPPGAPLTNSSYGISAIAAGAVWINEFNVEEDLFGVGISNEFVEIAGLAGSDLANWTLECYNESSNRYATYRFPLLTRLRNDTNGFGFLIVGESNRPANLYIALTNSPGSDDRLAGAGAFRLLDSVGNNMHAIRYGSSVSNFNLFPADFAGTDDVGVFSDATLHLTGTGGLSGAFTWTANTADYGGSPGVINPGQGLTGGNTDPPLPSIVCPSGIVLGCISAPVPTANIFSVTATGFCGSGAVTITHAGDTTNSGTGCQGNPRIITRTYRAVSTCATTSECRQPIVIEDKTPPAINVPTQTLQNVGFEQGTLNGWTAFGVVSNNIKVVTAMPKSGFFHGRITPPLDAAVKTSGVYQTISAVSGETWLASIHLAQPTNSPLASTSITARLTLQFLDSTGGVVQINPAPDFTSTSPKDTYIRYAVRSVAPSNTAFARLLLTYIKDANTNTGTLYMDDAVLTPFVITAGVSCAVIPNYTPLVTATDGCGSVLVTQFPTNGTIVGSSNIVITFTATDPCGLIAQGSIIASVEDAIAPTAPNPPLIRPACVEAIPPPDPSHVLPSDNCGSVAVTFEEATIGGSSPCKTSTRIDTYVYRLTDTSGNFVFRSEVLFINDKTGPVASCTSPDLTNGSFEAGTFANWSPFGTHLFVTNLQPRAGTKHAVFYGATNGSPNFTGVYQDKPAAVGQGWRAGGFILQPASQALQGSNRVELKIEFLNSSMALLQTNYAAFFTSNSYRDVYVPVSVTATAPVSTAFARCTVLLVQPNTPSNAPGTVYLDDFTLTRHIVSADPDLCNAFIPDVRDVPVFVDCGTVYTYQLPPIAFPAALGWNTNVVYAYDACSNTTQCVVNIYVVDDVSPLLISGPADVVVETTNAVPAPNTNSVVGADTCGIVLTSYEGDTNNGGSGMIGDPLIITRTYRVQDTFSNSVLHRQIITVQSSVPPAPTNVVVRSMSFGSNLVVHSLGTNSWSVAAEYTTNLIAIPQVWTLLPAITNSFVNGTNITTFQPPVTNSRPVLYRIRQQYP